MAIESVIPAVAGVLTSLVGLALRASRRNRLRGRVGQHLAMADEFASRDAAMAETFRSLASEAAEQLALLERRSLRRKVDPAAVFAVLFLTLPAAYCFYLAWGWDSGWRLPALAASGAWTLIWGGVGITQLFTDHSDELEASRGG